jgi:hypothetical protein
MKNLKITLAAAFAAAAIVASPQARGTQITGTIGFTTAPHLAGGQVSSGGGLTTVTFHNPIQVDFGTGNYSTTVASVVDFNPISWSGSGGSAILTSSNNPEWSFTIGAITYSFDLPDLMLASFDPGSPNSLSLSGEGLLKITGFEDTFATFALQGTGEGFSFTILQASNTALPGVPDSGSALVLLGLALIALEGLRRKLASRPRLAVI